ncbi:MAG: hypothetical protein C4527_21290 [Candidatus Omnitrophota bacterium]|nr:MAG: hypothetical protein C4527_21290 [Candidatus Omnitrophota bacterium]
MLLALILFFCSVLFSVQPHPETGLGILLSVAAVILSATIGICTYNSREKDGIHCFLYHYPILRSELYWSKFLCGLILACLPAIVLVISVSVLLLEQTHFSPTDSIFHMLKNQRSSLHFILFMVGLLPYCCGVLFTHAIRHPIYALLESIPGLALAFSLYFFLQFYPLTQILQAYVYQIGAHDKVIQILPVFSWILFLLLAGLALAGWRAATDRNLLIGSILYRQLYISRLYLFVVAVTVILVKVGWVDLFYLITGIHLGIG